MRRIAIVGDGQDGVPLDFRLLAKAHAPLLS